MRHVSILNKLTVPAPTKLVVGMEVVKVGPGPFLFGRETEALGTIQGITKNSESGDVITVAWATTNEATLESEATLLAFIDLQAEFTKLGRSLKVEPIYRVDQVLFIKPMRGIHPSPYYPAIGSPSETDVKVTAIFPSTFGNHILYQVYIPSIGYADFKQDQLVTAKERERILHDDFKEYLFTADALPFFRRGERVKSYDGFIYNQDETVVVKINPELKNYLSWSIKQD